MSFAKFPDLITPYEGGLHAETPVTDIIVLLLTALALSYGFLGNIFAKEVPHQFFFKVPQASDKFVTARQQKTDERRIAYVFEQQKLDFAVLWGSQSGRAEIIARQLAKSFQDRFGLRTLAADLDDFDHNHLVELKENQPCAFIISTYGDGDPPDGAEGLWSFLNTEKDNKSLSSLRYLIFGLGNSNYRQYNYIAKTIDARLKGLGATRLGNLGQGDDASGDTETDFLCWRNNTQALLQTVLGLSERVQIHRPFFSVQENISVKGDKVHYGLPLMAAHGQYNTSYTTTAVVKDMRKLWETEDRLCIHAELDLGDNRRLKYKTGDHLAIWPCNPEHEVDTLLKRLGCLEKRHIPITIEQTEGSNSNALPFPTPTTLDALFRSYVEICGKLSMDFVNALAEFAPSDESRDKLLQLGGDSELFKNIITNRNITLAGLLNQMDDERQWKVPLSLLLERFKPMQPRYYSISSSAMVNPRVATITFVVKKPVAEQTDINNSSSGRCLGLSTGYLWALERACNTVGAADAAYPGLSTYALGGPRGALSGGRIFCNPVQTSFKMPMKASTPIIMIGAGTGVAPFRAFVEERMRRSRHEHAGRTLLFMGFRNFDIDFIYKDDWAEWQQGLGPGVFDYWAACSRDGQGENRMYVQDLVEQHETETMDLLEVAGCRVYICGSAAMAKDVVDRLVQMRCRRQGCSREDALGWVRQMRQFDTLLEDVWG